MSITLSPLVDVPVETSFRFSDWNRESGRTYGQSLSWELPDFVMEVVRDAGLDAEKWNALVEAGETYDVVGDYRSYSLDSWRSRLAARRGTRARGSCPDCFGTCVAEDTDGSLTGTVGTPIVCHCT